MSLKKMCETWIYSLLNYRDTITQSEINDFNQKKKPEELALFPAWFLHDYYPEMPVGEPIEKLVARLVDVAINIRKLKGECPLKIATLDGAVSREVLWAWVPATEIPQHLKYETDICEAYAVVKRDTLFPPFIAVWGYTEESGWEPTPEHNTWIITHLLSLPMFTL